VIIETAKFDIQRINNPKITGKQYQKGEQLGFQNVRAYVLHRDEYKCQGCGAKEVSLQVHHIQQRKDKGSDKPSNLITLCKKCHDGLHVGKIKLKLQKPKSFRAETFMSMVWKSLVDLIQAEETFGYITAERRKLLGLEKSHVNDAFVIANGTNQSRCSSFKVECKRKNNRCLQLNRKGFKPSIRRQRYGFRPKDMVMIADEWFKVKGVHCKGSRIQVWNSLGKLKSLAVKLINRHYYQNGMVFGYE
jgi:hypothetical protein